MPTNTNKPRRPASFHQSLKYVIREGESQYGANRPTLDTPEKIYEFFNQVIKTEENFEQNKEHVIVIPVNARLKCLGYNVVSIGTVNEASAHPREIMRPVIMAGAYGFLMLHNHPSHNPSPSRADESITRRISEAAQLMQIKFLDHVICGSPEPGQSGYFSFREAGLIS